MKKTGLMQRCESVTGLARHRNHPEIREASWNAGRQLRNRFSNGAAARVQIFVGAPRFEFIQPTNRNPSRVRFSCTVSTSGSLHAINFA